MARSFYVHHLICCESVEYLDPTRPYRDSILNRVDYSLRAPPNTEFPFEPAEFWLFARFYWLRDLPGRTPPLMVRCMWRDHPSGAEVEVWRRNIGRVGFRGSDDVIDRSWAFRNFEDTAPYRFPGIGRYEFRLCCLIRKWPWQRVVGSEHIRVEV